MSSEARRGSSIGIRLRTQERGALEAAAASRGEHLSEYVRNRALEATEADLPKTATKEDEVDG